MIIPSLPTLAIAEIKAHNQAKKIAVYRIVDPVENPACPNCMDEHIVYVSFLGTGPTKTPTTMMKPSTWVDTGWYVIERTAAYPCPRCSI